MFGGRRQQEKFNAARADVDSLQGRLAADVSNLNAGDDAVARQALADASERYNAAGALLGSATSLGELEVARRIVIEGLTATRIVRQAQGLPLGADLPAAAPTVDTPTAVVHDGQEHIAYPAYHPERPHYFGGGPAGAIGVPAGYYRTPFWQKAMGIGAAVVAGDLIGNALGEAFDGSGGYDGDGGGFDNGGGWADGSDGFDGGW